MVVSPKYYLHHTDALTIFLYLFQIGVRAFGQPYDVLNPHGTAALLTGETGTDSLPEGRKTLGIIEGDAVPQHFIPKLIELYQAGQFPFDRLIKFYNFSDINQAIADAKRGDTIKPVLRISEA